MQIHFSSPPRSHGGVVVLFASQGAVLSPLGVACDGLCQGLISRAISQTGFLGKKEQVVDVILPEACDVSRVMLVGVGETLPASDLEKELLGGAVAGLLLQKKIAKASVVLEEGLDAPEDAALVASGVRLRHYPFFTYKPPAPDYKPLEEVTIITPASERAQKLFKTHDQVAEGVHLARTLVNEPPNVLTPKEFAKRAKALETVGVEVEILTAKDMKKLGMNAFVGVGLGSANGARCVILKWNGGEKGEAPVALIGKGVTFDSGGISIKPSAGMEDMKGDMAGAAAVLGAMHALAHRKACANVVGILGCVENMPDGKAQRPGDIVTSLSGKTIAVLNTDAEGRLVLADLLWYCEEHFKPKAMVNLATLTGAVLVALGKEYAGLFSNNDALSQALVAAGEQTGDKLWRLPLAPEYDKLIDCDMADMKNTGGRYAGSITAAQFLQRFVRKVPWAHLDIAGVGMDSPKTALNVSWASGFGVRLLNRLIEEGYEAEKGKGKDASLATSKDKPSKRGKNAH